MIYFICHVKKYFFFNVLNNCQIIKMFCKRYKYNGDQNTQHLFCAKCNEAQINNF